MRCVHVLVLGGAESSFTETALVEIWKTAVPAAVFHLLPPRESEDAGFHRLIKEVAGKSRHIVLAGTGHGAIIARKLVSEIPDRLCQGVLICGAPPAAPPPELDSPEIRLALRLVWEAENALIAAADLGDELGRLRAHGFDAQGIVVPATGSSDQMNAAAIRASSVYLAELVAISLAS